MDAFASFLHLLIGFMLLGVLIDVGGYVTYTTFTTLVIIIEYLAESLTFAVIGGVLPFVVLELCTASSPLGLPPTMVEVMPTVAVYEGLPRRSGTSESTMALINYLAVISLVSAVVDVQPAAEINYVGRTSAPSVPVPIAVVQILDMVVGLVSSRDSLVPTGTHVRRAQTVVSPLLRSPKIHIFHVLMVELLHQQQSFAYSPPQMNENRTGLALPQAMKKPDAARKLPFDVGDLFRNKLLPPVSKQDVAFWRSMRALSDAKEPSNRPSLVEMADLNMAGVFSRTATHSALFPSISEAHIGSRPRRELPPRPHAVVVHPPSLPVGPSTRPQPRASVLSAQFRWSASSGVPLMEALGFDTSTATGSTRSHGVFKWNVESGVPLMAALGVGTAPVGETGATVRGFKWNVDSGVPLMEALAIGTASDL